MKEYNTKSKAERKAEVDEIIKKLETGVQAVFESDNYKKWLETFAKFYHYSFNNTILICMQRPEAKVCNSFGRWKSLGRYVKKGAQGIKILCPVKYNYEAEQDVFVNGQPVYNSDGSKETEKVTKEGLCFKVGYTFDIADTEGAELPSLTKKLEESPDILKAVIEQIMAASDVPIAYDDKLGENDAYGYYNLVEKRIGIRKNLSTMHTCKTIIHELSHSKLHSSDKEKISQSDREIQAESVAFTVLNYFGFDTSDYSFGYVASYSKGKDVRELQASLSIIEKTSRELIDWLVCNTDLGNLQQEANEVA